MGGPEEFAHSASGHSGRGGDEDQTPLLEFVDRLERQRHLDHGLSALAETHPFAERAQEIADAIADCGRWESRDVWAADCWTRTAIAHVGHEGRSWYEVRVESGGVEMTCRCRRIPRAIVFAGVYFELIKRTATTYGWP
jgi:hypothetical protein